LTNLSLAWFPLAWRMLKRDWSAGELRVLFAALFIAVASVTTINLLTDRLGRLLLEETAEILGGDLVIRSSKPLEISVKELATGYQLEVAEVIEFQSVVIFEDEVLLTAVKAVSNNYPVVGALQVAPELYGDTDVIKHGPSAGEIWVGPRVLNQLGASVGDQLALGALELKVTNVLTYEPDRGDNFFNLSPRVMMSHMDIEAAKVVQPASRVRYKLLVAGDHADGFEQDVKPLLRESDRVVTVNNDADRTSNTVTLTIRYIGFTSLLTIFLAAIAIAMAARRYSSQQFDVSAMLRCIGASQRQITEVYLWQITILVLAAGVLGTVAGWLGHLGLLNLMGELLPIEPPAAHLEPYYSGMVCAILLMASFALPPILRLRDVPPLRVFRNELMPMPVTGWVILVLSLISLGGVVQLLFGQLNNVLFIVCAAVVVLALLGVLLYGLLKLIRRRLPLHGNLLFRSLRNLSGHSATSAGQILAFGLTLMIMVTLLFLRSDLIASWQAQMPKDVPNNFAYNIQPFEMENFKERLLEQGIETPFFPIVRGRLQTVNGDKRDNMPNRELNFTWAEKYPSDNKIVDGEWTPFSKGVTVSLESEIATRLNIVVGDVLNFNVAGRQLSAKVTSLRTVDWQSFNPNFYVMFSAGSLDSLPMFYLTSFKLDESEKLFLVDIIKEFPSVTIIEVDTMIKQFQTILGQVTLMVEVLMLFVLMAGFVVLIASIQANIQSRLKEGGLLRALGASKKYVLSATLMEFGLLGFVSGLLAVAGSQLTIRLLYAEVFNLEFVANYELWIALPLCSAILIAMVGYWNSRQITNVSPRTLLK